MDWSVFRKDESVAEPLTVEERVSILEARVFDLTARTIVLEADDAKVHGFIAWCYDKRAYLIPIVTALFAVLSAWVAARNNSLPGVQSEPTPPASVKPAEKTDPSIEKVRNNLKGDK